ncbi:hypothetical protein D0S45_19660 [Marinifilum sp. JC120]|nr:hypothetical protein D0S45_19660 [Marinifilum sp. JC120]
MNLKKDDAYKKVDISRDFSRLMLAAEGPSIDEWNKFHRDLLDSHEFGTKFYVADVVLSDFKSSSVISMQNLIFDSLIMKRIDLGGLLLRGAVSFGHFRCHTLSLHNECSFADMKVHGDFSLNASEIYCRAPFSNSVFLRGVQIVGSNFHSRLDFGSVTVYNFMAQGSTFSKYASFENTAFDPPIDGDKSYYSTEIQNCDFKGDVIFRGTKKGHQAGFHTQAFLTNSRFWGKAEFYDLVMNDVSFTRSQFNKEAVFSNLSLENVSFLYVDLSQACRFYNVRWRELEERLLLKDELESVVLNGANERFEAVKKQYGELVNYYDDVRDSERSEKFFRSEMYVKSKLASFYEKPAFWLYKISSMYGTSWGRAAFVLFFLLFGICPVVVMRIDSGVDYWHALRKAVSLVLLDKNVYSKEVSDMAFFAYVYMQLLILGQVALLFLAVRRRFRRGGVPG